MNEQAIVATLVAEFKAKRPRLATRVDAAGVLVLAGSVQPTSEPHVYKVGSRSRAGLEHTVNGTCSCEDAWGQDGLCAHRLAARLYEKLSSILESYRVRYDEALLEVQVAEADVRLAQAVLASAQQRLEQIVQGHAHEMVAS